MNFLASFLKALKPRYDDDVIDRLNYYYTCLIILILSITISAKQYVGQPIQCWVPAQFTGAWEQYAENYCFVQNTYWVNMDDSIPQNHQERDDREIGYYQWVPFILAIEALLFYIPCVIWRIFNGQSEISVENVVKMAAAAENIASEKRDKAIKTISRHIEDAISLQESFWEEGDTMSQILNCGKARGIYITCLYLSVKLLYVINVVGQFFLLNAFIGSKSRFWGLEILQDLYYGREWDVSGHFPRVTLCDFEVRVIGNLHRYTIQCVLMINMFNEKIFLFMWWWFLIVAIASIISLFQWVTMSIPFRRQMAFIRKYLRVNRDLPGPDARIEGPHCRAQNLLDAQSRRAQADRTLGLRVTTLGNQKILPSVKVSHNTVSPTYLHVYYGLDRSLWVNDHFMESGLKLDNRMVHKFVSYGLRPDGVLMLRILGLNAGDLITTEVVGELWRIFLERVNVLGSESFPTTPLLAGKNQTMLFKPPPLLRNLSRGLTLKAHQPDNSTLIPNDKNTSDKLLDGTGFTEVLYQSDKRHRDGSAQDAVATQRSVPTTNADV